MVYLDSDCTTCLGIGSLPLTDSIEPYTCPDCLGNGKEVDWSDYYEEYDRRYHVR